MPECLSAECLLSTYWKMENSLTNANQPEEWEEWVNWDECRVESNAVVESNAGIESPSTEQPGNVLQEVTESKSMAH